MRKVATFSCKELEKRVPLEDGLVFVTTAKLTTEPGYSVCGGGIEFERGGSFEVSAVLPDWTETATVLLFASQEFIESHQLHKGDEIVIVIAKKPKK